MSGYNYLDDYAKKGPTYFWFKSHYTFAFNVLRWNKVFNIPNAKIVDIGSGEGFFADFLHKEKIGRLILDDHNLTSLKRSIRKHNDLGCMSDICKLPFASESFDLVCALDVIEHIEDDKRALKEIFRVVKKGGYLLLTVPAYNFLYGEHDEFAGHIRRYTLKEVRKKLTQSCFDVVWFNYAKAIAFFPMLFLRFFKKLSRKSEAKIRPDFFNLPVILNRLFNFLLCIEMPLFKYTRVPFGVSVICLGKKEK